MNETIESMDVLDQFLQLDELSKFFVLQGILEVLAETNPNALYAFMMNLFASDTSFTEPDAQSLILHAANKYQALHLL